MAIASAAFDWWSHRSQPSLVGEAEMAPVVNDVLRARRRRAVTKFTAL
jgi:hypothetical protein